MTLDQLCSRAPWSGVSTRGWGNDDEWTLTEADVRAAYAAIVAGASKDVLCTALGVDGLSHDKAARCLWLLKNAGLIQHVKGTGWVPRGTP